MIQKGKKSKKKTANSKERVSPKPKKPAVEKANKKTAQPYIYALGRRKGAVARVRLFEKGKGKIEINDKPLIKYFPSSSLQIVVKKPLEQVGVVDKHDATIIVRGGGMKGQAESISLGISRALVKIDANLRKSLKPLGLLKRDPRVKERKKYGLKRARRAPQWQKR